MTPSNSLIILVLSCSLFFFAIGKEEFVHKTNEEAHHYHTFQPSSLLPSSSCIPSAKGDKKTGLLEVVHKHGPCSKFSKDMVKPLTVEEIFTHDQSRVDSIRDRLTTKKGKTDTLGSKVTLAAKSGRIIGSGNYIVTVGLGTPKKDLSVIFDTGSDLTWTQCKPCVVYCYKQQQPIFAPSESSTYSNISCTSTECAGLISATGNEPRCISTTCVYDIQYADKSFTVGFFGKDKLTLTSKDIVNDFHFGCGQYNKGFRGAAGLLGLGRDKLSIVSQTATQYGKVFSYCLPSTSSATGYLTFGSSRVSSNVKYTPISTLQRAPSLYGLNLEAIFVGGTKLAISPMVFKSSGMIIDSGAVITRLPPTAYSALKKAFRAQMAKYTLTKPLPPLLDTCYDFTNTRTVTAPIISFLWGGNTLVKTARSGIFFANGISQVCLAYTPNDDESQIGIFGNTQQKTLQVVYDVNAGKVGFAQGGCA